MQKSDLVFIGRRPLFYAAILFCTGIATANFFIPNQFNYISKADVSGLAKDKAPVVLTGRIISEVDEKQSFYHETYDTFVLKCESAAAVGDPAKPRSGQVRVTVRNPSKPLQYGDMITLEGNLTEPQGLRNPGGFDYRAYLDRQGIHSLLYTDKKGQVQILALGQGNPIIEKACQFRHFLSDNLSQGFAESDAAFLKALLLGERSDITVDFEELFIRTGTLHILAVSGFNVGFLSAAILFFLAPLRLSKNLKWIIVLIVIWIYCLLVGWQAPLVRASVMATILIFSRLLGRRADILNSLGLAAILILAVNPKNLFDVGFQLSFAAVAGLALFMRIFTERKELFANEKQTFREKISLYAEELFWVSFVASFVTLPITVQSFYLVTPLSLLANMIVVPLSFWLFFCGIVYFLTFWWVPRIIFFIPLVMKILMQVFTRSLFWIAHLPLSCITVGRLSTPLELLLIAGLFYLFFDPKIKNRSYRAVLIFIFSLNIFLFQEAVRHFDRHFTMTALDVGQGDAIYFEFPHGGNLLMDAGKGEPSDKGRRVIVPFLKSKGVRSLDAVVISHPQADHIGGMQTVLEEIPAVNVYDAKRFYASHIYQALKDEIARQKDHYEIAGRGMSIQGFRDVKIEVLNPDLENAPAKNINNDCVNLKISYGKTAFLLTGDIEYPAMKDMMDAGLDLRADVLKVPHHGAKLNATGRDFVEAVSPKFSVISVGERNPFHHPRPETLEILNSIPGNTILRTDQKGAVTLISNGNTVTSAA